MKHDCWQHQPVWNMNQHKLSWPFSTAQLTGLWPGSKRKRSAWQQHSPRGNSSTFREVSTYMYLLKKHTYFLNFLQLSGFWGGTCFCFNWRPKPPNITKIKPQDDHLYSGHWSGRNFYYRPLYSPWFSWTTAAWLCVASQVSKHTFSRFSGTSGGETPAPSRVSSSHSNLSKLASSTPGRWQPFFQPELTSSPTMLDDSEPPFVSQPSTHRPQLVTRLGSFGGLTVVELSSCNASGSQFLEHP